MPYATSARTRIAHSSSPKSPCWHAVSVDETASEMGTSPGGLSAAEASGRLREDGPRDFLSAR
jgi:hypothetical protein